MASRIDRIGLALTTFVLLVAFAAAPVEPAEAPPRLEQDRLPAAGRQATTLTVPRFGRYAVSVESAQGTGLQLVDRMAGAGPVAGRAGKEDGRLDVFLDRGEFQVRTYGDPAATGQVKLGVHAFSERRSVPVRIVERKLVSTSLGDYQELSYWLRLESRRTVSFEAAGRHLRDLRLWHGGLWLIDAAPHIEVIEPRAGQPLLLCRLSVELEAGLYRLTAYGGVSQPWAEDTRMSGGGDRPFHLRFGIPALGKSGRQWHEVGPFGFDRFLVPGQVDYVRLELPEGRPATVEVRRFNPSRPTFEGGLRGAVDKRSLPPVAEVRPEEHDGLSLITVTAEAGQPYVLQHFEVGHTVYFHGSGSHWISTIHSGHPGDSIDATALLVRTEGPHHRRPVREQPLREQVVELSSGSAWSRRANLLDALTLFLRVEGPGSFTIHSGEGAEARFRVEPFLLSKPPGYEPPPFLPAGSTWDLDAGFYVLTVKPEKKGVLEMTIRSTGWMEKLRRAVGLEEDAGAVRASVRFPDVPLRPGDTYGLFLNRQPEVSAGAIVRRLPLDLTDPLPLTQRPGEIVDVPFEVRETGFLEAVADDGSRLDLSVDGSAFVSDARVPPGRHRARIRYSRDGGPTLAYTLRLVPESLLAETPLPPLPAEAFDALPDFPALTDRAPSFLDLGRRESRTFLVSADRPGLYRLETSGLLATEGNLRTRVVTSLHRRSENGAGRNFLVQQYLREGDYQVSVTTRGRSAGHLGVHLRRTAVAAGGALVEGTPARAFVKAGEAVSYRLRVDEKGRYRVRSIGVGRTARVRIEEPGGWPLDAPEFDGDLVLELEGGEYRLILLPEPLSARRLTLVERVAEPPAYAGHGPHDLRVSKRVRHLWLESPEGEGRRPDVWRFRLPASATARIDLTGEMHGDLVRAGEGKVAYVPPQRGWQGELEAGDYELRVTCLRVNNQVDYDVGVGTEELLPGQTRLVKVPGILTVSIGDPASRPRESLLAELGSFGAADVRARLYGPDGRLVSVSDDRPGDWNFLLAERLAPGAYRLRVDPVGTDRAETLVTLDLPEEHPRDNLSLPLERELAIGRGVDLYPLDLPPGAGGLTLAADSAESIGVSLEVDTGDGWRTLASRTGSNVRLEMPVAHSPERHRLRVWSLDKRGNPVRLRAFAGAVPHVDEAQLASGLKWRPLGDGRGASGGAGMVAVTLDRPGCFKLTSEGDGVRFSTAAGRVAGAVSGLVPATGPTLWLATDLAEARVRLAAERVALGAGDGASVVRVDAGGRLVCDVSRPENGPVVVRARSAGAIPGIELRDRTDSLRAPMSLGRKAAVSVAFDGEQSLVHAWTGRAGETPDLRLEAWSFAAPEVENAGWGDVRGELTSAPRAFALPSGLKRLRLVLGPSVVATLSEPGAGVPRSVHWADGEALEEVFETSATVLSLLHLDRGKARFHAAVLPVNERDRLLAPEPGRPFEKRLSQAGTLRLEIPPSPGATLHVRGARDVALLGADGSIGRGDALPVPPEGGTLLLRHPPGAVFAWVERPGTESSDLWGETVAAAGIRRLETPSVVAFEERQEAFDLVSEEPRILHLRSAEPLVTRLERAGLAPTVEIHPAGVELDAYLPPGRSVIAFRGLGGEALSGAVRVAVSRADEIGEGLGPQVLLAAGETRVFSFRVRLAGRVGLGVRARSDAVMTRLLDASGKELGRGAVQMRDLEPGTYLLALEAPQDGTPVGAEPIVVGLERPETGPPHDVVRHYMTR